MKRNPWILLILVTLLILTLTSIPKIPKPPQRILFLDKIAHFVIYFLWGFALSRIWNSGSTKRALFAVLLYSSAVLFPALDELHQFLIAGRNPSLLDWLSDVTGAIAGFTIFAKWKRIRVQ